MKNFVLNSGSLKALAKYYEVSYPTVRQRLNNVIASIESVQDNENVH
ncbi:MULTISPECIES: DUF2089 family protein [Staphylococcus]|nr:MULTISPECIES: DUF2089 family protein [Staphylococcus]MDR5649855.1 DUF2089 family protein [Staphylococcus nepalensis]MDW8551812.1 DUF2089 family protein [Staphylococcus nepalensis]NWN84968.1 DUF2089 family protein [Staphylococcus sp.]RIO38567.1 DUF2089 family protein [Staphylococcus nepalensis]WQL21515.1 DUF2089 family protein [Staphylococcus nepalensis]